MLLYVAASDNTVSGVLVQEKHDESKVTQHLVYYISEALLGAKLNYLEIEKVAYAVLISSRKLKHYFQAYEIIVPSLQPLGDTLRNKRSLRKNRKMANRVILV